MTSYKETQKELRRPDELQKIGQQAVPWLELHGRTVVLGVIGVLAVGGLVTLVFHIRTRAEEKASHDFGAALQVLGRSVTPTAPATTPEGEDPPFKTDAEKDQALVDTLKAFRKENEGRKASASAALPLAQALIRQGKAPDALPLLDEFLKEAEPNDPLRAAAFEARGYSLEAQGKTDEALVAFDQLARENKTDFLKGMGQYHRGRLLQMKGDKDGAAKQFAELEASSPNTAAARLAKERIALLVAQGVVVPQVAPLPIAFDAGL